MADALYAIQQRFLAAIMGEDADAEALIVDDARVGADFQRYRAGRWPRTTICFFLPHGFENDDAPSDGASGWWLSAGLSGERGECRERARLVRDGSPVLGPMGSVVLQSCPVAQDCLHLTLHCVGIYSRRACFFRLR